jgi:hypothetical protein
MVNKLLIAKSGLLEFRFGRTTSCILFRCIFIDLLQILICY